MGLSNLDKQIDKFKKQYEAKLMNELFGDDVLTDEQEWETYSVSEVSKELGITLGEATFLVNRGIFKSYRAGNEFRCHKKSVEEKKRIIEICTSYRDNKTITVMELSKILGLGKTGIYRLVNKCFFKTYVVYGKMRVDVESFEEWYAGQFHYTKVNGERPGKKYGKTIHVVTVYKVLGLPKATARDLIKRENIEVVKIDGCTRIMEDSFWKWFKSQDKYTLVKTIREVEGYVD